jgi:hypothetical protein
MLGQLDATGGRFGLQTMCEAGGMANAMIVERLGSAGLGSAGLGSAGLGSAGLGSARES